MALGRSLVASVHTNDSEGISLVLWDTSGDDDDININETLLEKMKENMSGDESGTRHSSMPSLDHSPNTKQGLVNGPSKGEENIQNVIQSTIHPKWPATSFFVCNLEAWLCSLQLS